MYGEISRNKTRTIVLMAGFFVIIGLLGYVVTKATGNPSFFSFFIIGALVWSLISYFAGEKIALSINRAQEIQKKDNPRLYRIVENLSITTGMPMPKVYIMNDPAPNAFAAGRNPKNSVVCATTGLLDIMTDSELEAVMAHEMGHIQNYDVRVNTIAFALVGVVSLIADMFWYSSIFGNRDSNGNSVFQLIALVSVILAPIAASLLQLSISRKREYLADATGALTTRHPEAMADALEKLKQYGQPLQKQNTATAHMFLVNPLSNKKLAGLFSTHPPLDDRIKKLRGMELN